jgi:two-component system sensor histidine kinase KdpD
MVIIWGVAALRFHGNARLPPLRTHKNRHSGLDEPEREVHFIQVQSGSPAMTTRRSLPSLARTYAETLAMVAASTGIGLLIAPRWGTSAVDLLYLVPVLAAASLYGLRPALLAGAASALAYNFFFTAPLHTFRIHSPSDIVTVVMLFAVAVVTSQLASRMRTQTRIAAAAAARNATIAGFAGRLLSSASPGEIARITCSELALLFDCNVLLRAPAGEGEAITLAADPTDAPLTPGDIAAAAWVIEHGREAGRGSPRLNPAEWLFFPVKSGAKTLAAVGLARDDGRPPVEDEGLALLASLLDQTALALERAALEAQMRDLDGLRDRDRLRGALLSSVGHDLRTPLTAIVAAASELRRGVRAGDEALVATLESEAAKLDRYISNLLDMARIEAGSIRLKEEAVDLVDAVSSARRDLKRGLAGHPVTVDLPADLPLVRADPHLLHHVLINVLDNAARHGGAETAILIAASYGADGVRLTVEDEGPGFTGDEDRLDRFVRIDGNDRTGGSGLGLAIVKGFADAMGIGIEARNRAGGGGALIALHFPGALIRPEMVASL